MLTLDERLEVSSGGSICSLFQKSRKSSKESLWPPPMRQFAYLSRSVSAVLSLVASRYICNVQCHPPFFAAMLRPYAKSRPPALISAGSRKPLLSSVTPPRLCSSKDGAGALPPSADAPGSRRLSEWSSSLVKLRLRHAKKICC